MNMDGRFQAPVVSKNPQDLLVSPESFHTYSSEYLILFAQKTPTKFLFLSVRSSEPDYCESV